MKDRKTISNLFSSIAHRYDFLNHFLSFAIDYYWRKKAVKEFLNDSNSFILDLCTGTCDLALTLGKNKEFKGRIIATDFSGRMLGIGKQKIRRRKLDKNIILITSDVLSSPFAKNIFDGAMVAFGIRNLESLQDGLNEIFRILKHNAQVVILETGRPNFALFRFIYYVYFKYILPGVGNLISGNNGAYTYLRDSVLEFYTKEEVMDMMNAAGFAEVSCKHISFGIVDIFKGRKLNWEKN